MKKFLCFICILFVSILFPSCSNNVAETLPPESPTATEELVKIPEYDLINSDEYVQGQIKGIGYRVAIGDDATEEDMRIVFADLCSNDSYALHTVWYYGIASDVETIGSFSVGMLEETSTDSEPQFTPCTYSKEVIASLRERANSQDSANETRSIPNPSIFQESFVPDNIFYPVETVIFNTAAEDNGLGDTAFYITGKVTSRFDMAGYDTIQFSTDHGEISISSVLIPLDIDEGDITTVYFLYTGFSDSYNCPCGIYIYHEQESTTTTTPVPDSSPTPTAAPAQNTAPIPTPAPTQSTTAGQRNALSKANQYLAIKAFSHSGLVKQLEYEGYSTEEATYGADNCGADWNEQALKSAKNYLSIMAFSHSGLIKQLEYEGFTTEQATYGANNCGADWDEQAAKKAQNYIDIMSFSRQTLIDQLKYDGFTQAQAEYGVSAVGY